MYNSVIRCSRVGVINLGGSNLFQGLHVYSTCSLAPGTGNVTIGFVAGGTQTRITIAQLDDSPIVVTAVRQFLLTDSLVFDRAGVIIAPQEASPWDPGQIFITHNVLAAHYFTPYVAYDTASGALAPGSWRAFVVAENGFDNPGPQNARSTRAHLSIELNSSTPVCTPMNGGGVDCCVVARATADAQAQLLLLPQAPPSPLDWKAANRPRVLSYIDAGSPSTATAGTATPFHCQRSRPLLQMPPPVLPRQSYPHLRCGCSLGLKSRA